MFVLLGLLSLFAGAVLLVAPQFLKKISDLCNKTLIDFDKKIENFRVLIGVLLVLSGTFIFLRSFPMGLQAWLLNAVALLAFLFGVKFLFFPKAVSLLSGIGDTLLFSYDEMILSARKIIGILLIIVSLYFFFLHFRGVNMSAFYIIFPK